MDTKFLIPLVACVLSFALLNAADDAKGEEKSDAKAEGEYQRVLVYDKGSKPSAAAANAHYEWRKITADCCGACEKCMKEMAAKKEGTKPSASIAGDKECVAYLCSHCGKLVWSENGKEVTKEAPTEEEVQAVVKITHELSQPHDTGTKPAVQARQKMER